MNAKELVMGYLSDGKIMQLATSQDGQPWACTVHYYADEDLNLYWISTPERRHSQDIKTNPKVAVAIVGHENTPEEAWIAGISIEGTAELVGKEIEEKIGLAYITKTSRDPSALEDIKTGKNPHLFYKLTSKNIVLFDTKNFKDNPRQEININS